MERPNKRGYKVFVEHNSNNYQVIALSNESLVASFFNNFKNSAGDSKKDYYPYELFLFLKDDILYAKKAVYCKYPTQVLTMRKDPLSQDDLLEVDCKDSPIDDIEAVFVKNQRFAQEYNQLLYYSFEFEDVFFLSKDGLHDTSKIITELLNLDLNTLFEINSIKLIQDIFYEKIKNLNYDFEKVLSFEDYYEFKKDNRGIIDEIHYS